MSEEKANSVIDSDGFKDDLSMRDKSLLKRSISKHHNNNFKAGYVPVNEEALQKTGLRGRKTFAFWTLIALIFVMAMANMALTITMLTVLKVGRGLESLELIPGHGSIKFYGNTDFVDIYKRDGKLEGFSDYPVLLNSDNGSIVFKILPRSGRSVVRFLLDAEGVVIPNTALLSIKDKRNEIVFTTDQPTYNVQMPMKSFDSKLMQTNRIVSDNADNLDIETKSYVNIKGAEGVSMDGKEILWSADQNIFLKSINGSILLSSGEGTFIDMKKIPIVSLVPKYTDFLKSQFKVCVCMPQGKLFRIPVPKERNSLAFCTHINMDTHNPCM